MEKQVQEKLYQAKDKLEKDKNKLEKLIEEKGSLLASELITGKKSKKIEILNEAILKLKIQVEEISPALISGLELKIAQLKSDKLIAEKKALEKEQLECEKDISMASEKLIPLLEQAQVVNTDLQRNWASFEKISEKTGSKLSGKFKVSAGSKQMLNFVSTILIKEWQGEKVKRQSFYDRIRL